MRSEDLAAELRLISNATEVLSATKLDSTFQEVMPRHCCRSVLESCIRRLSRSQISTDISMLACCLNCVAWQPAHVMNANLPSPRVMDAGHHKNLGNPML